MRSSTKIPVADNSLFLNSKNQMKVFSRSSIILPCFVGRTFNIYNGSKFVKILISEEMVGHKIGEFCRTRSRYLYKKGKKK